MGMEPESPGISRMKTPDPSQKIDPPVGQAPAEVTKSTPWGFAYSLLYGGPGPIKPGEGKTLEVLVIPQSLITQDGNGYGLAQP